MTALSMTRGDTVILNVTVTNADGSTRNITGEALAFTAKRDYSETAALMAKSTAGSGISITNAAAGSAQVTIASSDTSGLAAHPVVLFWDLQLTDTSSRIFTVASGTLTVTPDVT